MNERHRTELWFWRLAVLAAGLGWYAQTHPTQVYCLWHDWNWLLPIGAGLALGLGLWIRLRRPPWWALAVALGLAALLLTIVFPALFCGCGCPLLARQSSCASNLRQIGFSCLAYAEEHDHTLPPTALRWTDALLPYLKQRPGLLHCPSARGDRLVPGAAALSQPVDYSLNPYLRGRRLTDLPVPPAYVVLAWCGDVSGPLARHNGGCNVVFADGHAKWIRLDDDQWIWNPWEPAPEGEP